jgi:uncharacterized protein (TIGR02271 family)
VERLLNKVSPYMFVAPLVLSLCVGCESSHDSRRTARTANQQPTTVFSKTASSQEVTVPVVKEELQVGKRQVQEGTTRVQKRIIEKPVEKSVTLKDENVQVEQRAANRPVKDPDKAFKEQTIEMTETKEVPMVTKEARQTGEVALKKDVQQQQETIRDTVRSTDIDVIKGGEQQASRTDWSRYEPDFRKNYQSTYANTGLQYEQVRPAYRYGYELANDPQGRASDWSSIEPQAKTSWEQNHDGAWDQYRDAVRYGWERARRGQG